MGRCDRSAALQLKSPSFLFGTPFHELRRFRATGCYRSCVLPCKGPCFEGRRYFNERTESEWPLVAGSAVESFAQGCVQLLGTTTFAPWCTAAPGRSWTFSSEDSLRMMARGICTPRWYQYLHVLACVYKPLPPKQARGWSRVCMT